MNQDYLKKRDKIVGKYNYRLGISDAINYPIIASGFVYSFVESLLDYGNKFTRGDFFEVAGGLLVGGLAFATERGISKLNNKKKQKALSNLEETIKSSEEDSSNPRGYAQDWLRRS